MRRYTTPIKIRDCLLFLSLPTSDFRTHELLSTVYYLLLLRLSSPINSSNTNFGGPPPKSGALPLQALGRKTVNRSPFDSIHPLLLRYNYLPPRPADGEPGRPLNQEFPEAPRSVLKQAHTQLLKGQSFWIIKLHSGISWTWLKFR